ncbi:MAG: hypothetical protein HFG73_06850 [Hungatella sp.]|nr:hypothetical protein [Hungatella sp.]
MTKRENCRQSAGSKTIKWQKQTTVMAAAVLALWGLGTAPGCGPGVREVWAAPAEEKEAPQKEAAEDENQEVIVISTAEEFVSFQRNCVSESYSKGKVFVLESDLNLQAVRFHPVPVFAGTFDGRGHSIIGLSVTDAGSNLGLFRFVQEGGTVKNLRVYGNLAPEGSRANIGGIAGTNRGRVENCSFNGTAMAQDGLGGIAGRNEETGVIAGCESYAELTGNLKTGGIAGYNEGRIEGCTNRGNINATGQEVAGGASSQPSAGTVGFEESVRVERVNDAGGIAGLSLGYIKNSANYGSVGYPHMGYNVGGIAGRQSGLIDQCANYGAVWGRKDTGGIVGQFEPYVSIDYEEDMFGSLESQMEELSDMGDSLSGMIESAGDTASSNLDQIDAQMGKMRDVGRFYKDVYREGGDGFDRDADRSLDSIQNILDGMDLEMAGPATKSHYQAAVEKTRQIKALRAEMDKGYEGDITDGEALKAWLEKRRGQLEQLAKYGEELRGELTWLVVNAPADTAGGMEEFGDELDDLLTETNTFMDLIRFHGDKARVDLRSMDEDMTAQADLLAGDVDALTDGLKNSRNQIRDQKRQIENQLDQIRGTISDGVDRAKEDRELFEDVSDLAGDGLDLGMVNGCINKGQISADYQAGGIAGIIGMETSLDPERDLEVQEEKTLNVTRNIRAIVLSCRNEEEITVTNDYAGGIVGKANLGALIRNENYGDITAEDGNYAGGITGSSAYVLRDNYNMCTIDGNHYMGGIAGWGTDILDNYSMVSFKNPDGEWTGAVAGGADQEGVIQGNYYVEEGMGAVDGVTYEGQAQGLLYEDFRAMEHMPEEFDRLSVVFTVEDQVLKTVYCQYGDEIPRDEIPQVPQKNGYYFTWEEKDLSCIRGNQKVQALYKPWNTTIASSDDKMPLLLAESNFYPGTSLILSKDGGEEDEWRAMEETCLIPEGFEIQGVYEYSIVQPEGAAKPEEVTVRVYAGYGKDRAIGLLKDGAVSLADSRRDGAYLVFKPEGITTFVILEPEDGMALWVLASVGAVGAAGCLIGAGIRRKKKGKAEKELEEAAAEENGEINQAEDEAGKGADTIDTGTPGTVGGD